MNFKHLFRHPRLYFSKGFQLLKNGIQAQFYKGHDVICELCGWEGQQFFDGKCPNCNSLPRTRLLPFSLNQFKVEIKTSKILNIGPNKNEYDYIKKKVSNFLNYDRIDILNYKHINLLQDITKSNLPDASYDIVIAWHVLEHIPDDRKAIAEVNRLLKPNGKFLVSVPIYPVGNKTTFEDKTIDYKDFENIHGHDDHCRSCGLDYFERFEEQGFKTNTLNVSSLAKTTSQYFGLNQDHVVWCFTK